jgi:hypothetical protein
MILAIAFAESNRYLCLVIVLLLKFVEVRQSDCSALAQLWLARVQAGQRWRRFAGQPSCTGGACVQLSSGHRDC